MKKFILPLLLILSIGLLIAAESEASDVVGYFKTTVATGGWEPFSLPFGYSSLIPDDVLGVNYNEMDLIQDLRTGEASMLLGGMWLGGIMEMSYGSAYWLNVDASSPGYDFFLMGKVDPNPVTITIVGTNGGGWTPFSLNEAKPILMENLIMPDAQEMDLIQDLKSGSSAMYLGGMWLGDLLEIEPTHVYWYNSTLDTNYDWTYTPDGLTRANTVLKNSKSK